MQLQFCAIVFLTQLIFVPWTAQGTLMIDAVSGIDIPGCGTAMGGSACRTIYYGLVNELDDGETVFLSGYTGLAEQIHQLDQDLPYIGPANGTFSYSIYGTWNGATGTIIDCNQHRGFIGPVSVYGLTMRGCVDHDDYGGAILVVDNQSGRNVTISDVHLEDSYAQVGGGCVQFWPHDNDDWLIMEDIVLRNCTTPGHMGGK